MKRTPLVCLFTFAAIISACSDSKEEPAGSTTPKKPSFADVAVNPRASWTTNKQRDTVEVKADRLIFPASGNDALMKKKADDILVSDRSPLSGASNREGFMRKVVSVSKESDQIVVLTEQANLGEVIVGKFEINAAPDELFVMDTGESTGASSGTSSGSLDFNPLNAPGLRPSFEVSKQIDLGFDKKDITFYQGKIGALDIPVKDAKLNISLNAGLKLNEASFHFKPGATFGGDISVPGGFFSKFNPSNYLNELHVSLEGEVAAKIALSAQAQLSLELTGEKKALEGVASKIQSKLSEKLPQNSPFEIPVLKVPFVGPPLPTPLGPIPITYEFEINLACSAGVSGGVTVEVGGEAKSNAKIGVKYEKDKGWSPVKDFNFQFTKTFNVTAGGSAEFKCGVEPKLVAKVAGVAGPEFFVGAFLVGKFAYEEKCDGIENGPPQPVFSIGPEFGVNLGVGAKAEVFGFKIAEAKFGLLDKTWPITDKAEWPIDRSKALGYCSSETVTGVGGSAGMGGSGGSGGSQGGSGGSGGSQGGSGGTAGSGGSGGSGATSGSAGTGSSSQGGSSSGSGGSSAQGGSGGSAGSGSSSQGGSSSGSGGSSSPSCGNGKIDSALEDCDGNDFSKTCAELTFNDKATGTPTCSSDCKISSASCDLGAACGDVCTDTETPQKVECGSCQQKVCEVNPYCCTVAWDLVCVAAVETQCGQTCN